jgi:hypothetical protein
LQLYIKPPTLNHADWLLNNAYRVTSQQNYGGAYDDNYLYDDFGRASLSYSFVMAAMPMCSLIF